MKMRGNNVLFIGKTCGLMCVKIRFTLCKRNESYYCCSCRCNRLPGFGQPVTHAKINVGSLLKAGVTGYLDLGNRLHMQKFALEACLREGVTGYHNLDNRLPEPKVGIFAMLYIFFL